jgi:hypothetical protein
VLLLSLLTVLLEVWRWIDKISVDLSLVGWPASSSSSSMMERAINMFHLSNHTGNESRSASRSTGGGDPYDLNALAELAAAG